MKIYLKTEDEIQLMRSANQLVGRTLAELSKHIRPGVTTKRLDQIAEDFIRDNGGVPSFKNYPNPFGSPFPCSVCASVNNVVVHGIPDNVTVLKDGDVISIDCGTLFVGYNGDSCFTFCVGNVTQDVRRLVAVTRQSLYKGIDKAVAGNHLGDIGNAISQYCAGNGVGVVRELTGHGIGRRLHEQPVVRNYGKAGSGILLKEGMCLAIEPITTLGSPRIRRLPDKWGFVTSDGMPSAHFEHTVVVRKGKAEILSSFDDIYI